MVAIEERSGLTIVTFTDLSAMNQRRLPRTKRGLGYAYNPLLRRWQVSVIVETDRNGHIRSYPGVNREIDPQHIECGEENALGNADANGRGDYCTGMVIMGRKLDDPEQVPRIITPCDHSRIALSRYAERSGVGENFWLLLASSEYQKYKMLMTTLGELPPFDVEGIDARTL